MALDYEPKKIVCVDCGAEVYLESYMASKTCRCKECQSVVDKEKSRIRVQKYRELQNM